MLFVGGCTDAPATSAGGVTSAPSSVPAAGATPTSGPALSFIDPTGVGLKLTVYTATATADGDPRNPVPPVSGLDYVLVYGRIQNTSTQKSSIASDLALGSTMVELEIPLTDLMAAVGTTVTHGGGESAANCYEVAAQLPETKQYNAAHTGYTGDDSEYGDDFGSGSTACAANLVYGDKPMGFGALAPGASVTGYFVSSDPIPAGVAKSDLRLFTSSEPVGYPQPYPSIPLPWS